MAIDCEFVQTSPGECKNKLINLENWYELVKNQFGSGLIKLVKLFRLMLSKPINNEPSDAKINGC